MTSEDRFEWMTARDPDLWYKKRIESGSVGVSIWYVIPIESSYLLALSHFQWPGFVCLMFVLSLNSALQEN